MIVAGRMIYAMLYNLIVYFQQQGAPEDQQMLIALLKNCKCGPSLRWDGTLYSHADEALVLQLTKK